MKRFWFFLAIFFGMSIRLGAQQPIPLGLKQAVDAAVEPVKGFEVVEPGLTGRRCGEAIDHPGEEPDQMRRPTLQERVKEPEDSGRVRGPG